MEILFGHLRNTRSGESAGTDTPRFNSPAVLFVPPQPQEPRSSRVRNLLLPLNGSAASLAAVDQIIADARRHAGICVHLLHVAPRLPRHAARFLGGGARARWLRSRAEAPWRRRPRAWPSPASRIVRTRTAAMALPPP